MKYVKNSNLPEGKVSLVAISSQAGESIKKLKSLGVETFNVTPDLNLPLPVNSHSDLQMLHMGNNTIFCQNEHLCRGELKQKFKLVKTNTTAGNEYPEDVRLNCAIIGNKIICNCKTIAQEVIEYAYINDYSIIDVNQGYARCSVCIVNENAIITDDKSIYTAAGKFLNDVLLITKGSIGLNGYNYGFIGGCCGKIDKDKLAFNGAIESHSDYKTILDFLNRNQVQCIELNNGPLYDIGGILPLCEF